MCCLALSQEAHHAVALGVHEADGEGEALLVGAIDQDALVVQAVLYLGTDEVVDANHTDAGKDEEGIRQDAVEKGYTGNLPVGHACRYVEKYCKA